MALHLHFDKYLYGVFTILLFASTSVLGLITHTLYPNNNIEKIHMNTCLERLDPLQCYAVKNLKFRNTFRYVRKNARSDY